MKVKNLLPIGSVVLLHNLDRRIMIYGRFQAEKETGKEFDYAGCFYPQGVEDTSKVLLFNQEDIKTLFFVGFQDIEEFMYREEIAKYFEHQENN